eukprot:g18333.t1
MCADDYVQSTPEQIRQALQRQKARAEELRRQKAKELKQKVQLEQDWQKTKHFLESHQFSDDLNAPKCSCFGFKRSYPLHEAAREGNWEMIMLLMKFGADPQKRDHKGKCASSYASQSKARRVRERFLSNGTEEFADTLLRELSRAVLQQAPKLFGSQLLIGNPRRLGEDWPPTFNRSTRARKETGLEGLPTWLGFGLEELLRAAELGAMGITRLQPKVVLAAFLLGLAAFTTSLRGMFLIVSKEGCRAVTGQVPDQLLREPSRVRQSLAQAIYYGLPWHGYRLALRLRQRWKEWSHRCSCCEGLKLLLASLLWIILAPISALLVTVTKILQARKLISRRTARWASPTHVTAIGPPTPMRSRPVDRPSQDGVAAVRRGLPEAVLTERGARAGGVEDGARVGDAQCGSDWALRELPGRSGTSGSRARPDRAAYGRDRAARRWRW